MVGTPGWYTLTAVLPSNGCTAQASAEVEENIPQWFLELGPDQTVWQGTYINLEVQTDLPEYQRATVSWTPEFPCNTCLKQFLRAKDSLVVYVLMEDEDGCVKTDSMAINELKQGEVYVPNIFAPETDGENGFFRVYAGNVLTRIVSMQVYDRWGEQVFFVEDVQPDDALSWWDGSLNGDKMQPAVYVWVMEVEFGDGHKELMKGDVTLIR